MMENEHLSSSSTNKSFDINKLTFLHYVYALIENGKFLEAQSVDY